MNLFVIGTRGFPHIQGGVEKHCEKLYTSMPEKLHITVFRRKPYLSKESGEPYKQIHFIDIPSTKIKGFESFFHSFLATCISIVKRPDIVHIHNIGPGLFTPLLRLFGIPVILTYHSPNYEHGKWRKFGRIILRIGEKLSLHYANRIIFVNKFQREKFPSPIKDKSVYIPNGIDPMEVSTETDYIRSIGLEPRRYILAVGRLTQEKGFDYLIDAFASWKNKDEYQLVIAGDSDHKQDYVEQIRAKARQHRIIMPGYVNGEPLRQLYSHAALFVLPSYNEGFPIVLLEAMSYNLSVLVSNIPANRQLDLPEKVFFPAGDIKTLSEKIDVFTKHTIDVCYNLEKYNWSDITSATIQVYEGITSD